MRNHPRGCYAIARPLQCFEEQSGVPVDGRVELSARAPVCGGQEMTCRRRRTLRATRAYGRANGRANGAARDDNSCVRCIFAIMPAAAPSRVSDGQSSRRSLRYGGRARQRARSGCVKEGPGDGHAVAAVSVAGVIASGDSVGFDPRPLRTGSRRRCFGKGYTTRRQRRCYSRR